MYEGERTISSGVGGRQDQGERRGSVGAGPKGDSSRENLNWKKRMRLKGCLEQGVGSLVRKQGTQPGGREGSEKRVLMKSGLVAYCCEINYCKMWRL